MIEKLDSFIEGIKNNQRVLTLDEASTKQGIIQPILHYLGWNIFNIEEVAPEFSVEGGRVDYCLRDNNQNKVFIEVKKPGEALEKHEEQLLFYSFKQGIKLASLTSGIIWWFYLPTEDAEWRERKFYAIDILQQDSSHVASKFIDLLSKPNVISSRALQNAVSIYKGKQKNKAIADNLPEAWNKLILEPNELLVELLSETTESLCGFKPENSEVVAFLKSKEDQFVLIPEEEPPEITSHPIRPAVSGQEDHISQDALIPYIVKALQKHGGRATKRQVEEEIFQIFKAEFSKPWYQQTVSHGVPRWKHNIAFAKERGKLLHGYIKSAEESGRGYWELTETGKRVNVQR